MMTPVTRQVAALMRDQRGLILRSQALALGLTRAQVEQRLAAGMWEAVHRGTYRASEGPADAEQLLLAACLAAGPQAVASHLSAAWMWGLVPRLPAVPHISVPLRVHPKLHQVVVHRSRDLDPTRTIIHKGIACTDPLRVCSDVAADLERDELVELVDAAIGRRTITPKGLIMEIERRQRPGRRGPAALRQMLNDRGITGGPPPSVLEAEAMRLFRRAGIPLLGREVRFGPDGQYRIDFFLAPGLAVEVDGFAHHWSPESKAHDEARRNQIFLSGVFLLVYTWRDVRFDGRRVAAEIKEAMAQRAA